MSCLRSRSLLFSALALVCLTGCTLTYHPPIQQGNALSRRNLIRLHRGLTESQVVYLLGTPVLADPPHPHRWLYVYYFKAGNGVRPVIHHLTVVFHEGHVVAIYGRHGAAAALKETRAKGK